ncbi:MAG: hypothetical protein KDN19_03120 [Verrucomicrobiae bacterium]|nr:hypothetical protein [Verrucomicrobiae bacterium]
MSLLSSAALMLTGCVFDGIGKGESKVAKTKKAKKDDSEGGLFSKVGDWMKRDKKKEQEAEKKKNALPIPQKLPIGSVHLVHEAGGFVLIRTGRTTEIKPEADLVTFDEQGRPTGKLKLSPERKGAFLAADIVEGHPAVNDRVVMFGYLDGQGEIRFENLGGDQDEVLE